MGLSGTDAVTVGSQVMRRVILVSQVYGLSAWWDDVLVHSAAQFQTQFSWELNRFHVIAWANS